MDINKETLSVFLNRLDIREHSECLYWSGHRMTNGYGVLFHNKGSILAHRFAYMAFVGDIPSDKIIHHICGSKSCVNTYHLECTDRKDHVRFSHNINGNKTHCPHGHEYKADNIYYSIDGLGRTSRKCKSCVRIRNGHKPRIPRGANTHCKNGHEYTDDNVYIRIRNGDQQFRECRKCTLIAQRGRRNPTMSLV